MRILFALFLASCCAWLQVANVNTMKSANTIAAGTWGGEHIALEISRNGAEIEFDCAYGQIRQPMALNAHGDFDLLGTFTPNHGGPVLRDETPARLQARYSGHVHGDTMSLTVSLEKDKVGTFTLSRGQQPSLRKCR